MFKEHKDQDQCKVYIPFVLNKSMSAAVQTVLSLRHTKQKLMRTAYWATAVPFFEKHIGHALN